MKKEKENEVMKKRIQKYLSGSNEGFSLVELIIVIAIMAILVGVVALAVIPNLERSRESKDLATLDSVCSALSVAVANAGSKASDGDAEIDCSSSPATFTCSNATIKTLIEEQIDPTSLTLGSSICTADGKIKLEWKTASGANSLKVSCASGAQCKYAKAADGSAAKFEVVGSSKAAAAGS